MKGLDKTAEAWEAHSDLDEFLGGTDDFSVKTVQWPGKDIEVGLKLLSEKDMKEIEENVRAWAKDTHIPYNPLNISISPEYYHKYITEVLALSLVNPDNGKCLVSCANELAAKATRSTIEYLAEELIEHTKDSIPENPNTLTQDEFDGLIEQLKKNQNKDTLTDCGRSTLVNLVLHMAALLKMSTG